MNYFFACEAQMHLSFKLLSNFNKSLCSKKNKQKKNESCFLLVVSIVVKKKTWPLRNLWEKHLIGVAGLQFQRSIIITARKMLTYRQIWRYTSRQQEGHCETEISFTKETSKSSFTMTHFLQQSNIFQCFTSFGGHFLSILQMVFMLFIAKNYAIFTPWVTIVIFNSNTVIRVKNPIDHVSIQL